MQARELETRDFDPRAAGENAFRAMHAFTTRIFGELRPEHPPQTFEESVADWRPLPSQDVFVRAVWHASSEIVATAGVNVSRNGNNPHVANFWISVLPEWRRRGIAKDLLRWVVEMARSEERRLLLGSTSSTSPAGEAFMARIGAENAQVMSLNQLLIADLARDKVRNWLDRAAALEDEFELGLWDGPYPETEYEAVAKMHSMMNTAPRDGLDLEDRTFSVDELRHWEASIAATRTERWSMYVRERRTGEIVGYTEVYWRAAHPEVLGQGDTVVAPASRNRGIGRWLKAAMIDKVVRERPEVQRVHTGNAASNEAMLRINEELGFRRFRTPANWQVGIEKVMEYLGGGK
jgi:GNAT superfamily N-acetyltransferase